MITCAVWTCLHTTLIMHINQLVLPQHTSTNMGCLPYAYLIATAPFRFCCDLSHCYSRAYMPACCHNWRLRSSSSRRRQRVPLPCCAVLWARFLTAGQLISAATW